MAIKFRKGEWVKLRLAHGMTVDAQVIKSGCFRFLVRYGVTGLHADYEVTEWRRSGRMYRDVRR